MERFLVRWAFNVAALWVAAKLLSGVFVTGDQFLTLVLAGLVLGLANMVVKPVLVILALPLILLTLGIAYFLVNVVIVFFTSWIVSGFHVEGFWAGVGAALIVWGVNVLLERLARRFEPAPPP
jgi:putative membrane protein